MLMSARSSDMWTPLAACRGDNFGNDLPDEGFALRGGEDQVGGLIEDGGESVEGDVPDELFPAAVLEIG